MKLKKLFYSIIAALVAVYPGLAIGRRHQYWDQPRELGRQDCRGLAIRSDLCYGTR